MGRKGMTLIEVLTVVIIFGILAAILIPQFSRTTEKGIVNVPYGFKTTVSVRFVEARPELKKKAMLLYGVSNRWGYALAEFRISLRDGSLQSVICKRIIGGFLFFDSKSEYSQEDTSNPDPVNWGTWLKRFMGIQEEVITGLKPDMEEHLQKQEKK